MISHASQDPRFREHPGLKVHGIESYIAVPLLRRDGSYFGTLCALDPEPFALVDQHVDVLGLLATLIAFELEAADERARKDAELVEAQRLAGSRERLMAVLGHDLRTPLSAILGAASLLLRTPGLPDSAQRRTGYIIRGAERMGRMVDDLLDFARGRLGGGIPVQHQESDIVQIVQQVVDEARAGDPGRTILVSCEGKSRGSWDEGRLTQALANLVQNALRYGSPVSAVEVGVLGREDRVDVSVHNQGEPIPPAIAADIFDPFRRGTHEGSAEKATGLGLGLYIVEEIARAHGGSVSVHSTAREGTTFTLTLPRAILPSGD